MVIDIELIRQEELNRFQAAIKQFFNDREDEYMRLFNEKLESGQIDPGISDYKNICQQEAEAFMSTRHKEVLKFIKKYIDSRLNEIVDDVNTSQLLRGKARVQFEVLKYILLAGEEYSEEGITS